MDISVAEFAGRMKRTLLNPLKRLVSGKSGGGYGKDNLPPLLGRRDARLIFFVENFMVDAAYLPPFERIAVYRKWCGKLEQIIEDTELIIAAMSSEDGIMREQRLLNLLCFLLESVLSAGAITVSEMRFIEGDYAIGNFVPNENIGKLKKRLTAAKNTEANILQGIEEVIALSAGSIRRHREYARQSASSHNLARYQNAFAEYTNEDKKNSSKF